MEGGSPWDRIEELGSVCSLLAESLGPFGSYFLLLKSFFFSSFKVLKVTLLRYTW